MSGGHNAVRRGSSSRTGRASCSSLRSGAGGSGAWCVPSDRSVPAAAASGGGSATCRAAAKCVRVAGRYRSIEPRPTGRPRQYGPPDHRYRLPAGHTNTYVLNYQEADMPAAISIQGIDSPGPLLVARRPAAATGRYLNTRLTTGNNTSHALRHKCQMSLRLTSTTYALRTFLHQRHTALHYFNSFHNLQRGKLYLALIFVNRALQTLTNISVEYPSISFDYLQILIYQGRFKMNESITLVYKL